MGSNPSRVDGVRCTSVKIVLEPKIIADFSFVTVSLLIVTIFLPIYSHIGRVFDTIFKAQK